MKDKIYTTEDAARIIGCHPDTVGRHCKKLKVPKVMITIEREVYNISEDLLEVLKKNIKTRNHK